jgi:hypothetical protein
VTAKQIARQLPDRSLTILFAPDFQAISGVVRGNAQRLNHDVVVALEARSRRQGPTEGTPTLSWIMSVAAESLRWQMGAIRPSTRMLPTDLSAGDLPERICERRTALRQSMIGVSLDAQRGRSSCPTRASVALRSRLQSPRAAQQTLVGLDTTPS